MSKQYIKIPKLNGQKARKKYYVSQVFEGHPAKGDIPMMIWILEEFVKDGEIVLDPMAGIGTTLLEGMRLFPNSLFIGIELEHKFVKWTNASIKKTERIARENWFMEVGKVICVQGDARDLERVIKEKVDKIVSSPPFGGQVQHKTNYLGKQKGESGFEYSEDPENIGNLPHGKFDKIISSPPFGQAQSGGGIVKKGYTGDKHSPQDVAKYSYMPENIGQEPGNISNLPYVDKVKGKTYLEAMFLVYQECFKVLKPDGLMILITKDFIRNYKRVHLGEDTLKLCQMAGFKHIHTYHRRIDNPSFWRNDYYKKHPEVEQIDCEDVLCFRKKVQLGLRKKRQ